MRRLTDLMSFFSKMGLLLALLVLLPHVLASRPIPGERVWRDLTEKEMSEWYSPVDRCVLESSNRFTSAQEIRRNCTYLKLGGWRGCAVGMGSNNFPCYPPFAGARKGFLRGVEGYTNHSHMPLLNAFRELAAANSALVLLGDSTMRQKLAALRCELMREDHTSWIEGNLRGILPCHTNLTIHFDSNTNALRLHGISIGPNSVNCLRGGLGKRHPHGIFENARDLLRRINEEDEQSMLVVANLGLWYNDDMVFRRVVPDVLEWLHNVSVSGPSDGKWLRNTVRWHETMAQHWSNEIGSGYYYRPFSEEKERVWEAKGIGEDVFSVEEFQTPTCCAPITNTTRGSDWRNEVAMDYLGEMKTQGRGSDIELIPFSDVTRPAADLHICHPTYKFDCTHYCYTPLLWQPMYYDIEEVAIKRVHGR